MAKKKVVKVDWVACLVVSIILGSFGVDKFLMGKIGLGILKLLTFGGFGIWWLVDVILVATKYKYEGIKWVE